MVIIIFSAPATSEADLHESKSTWEKQEKEVEDRSWLQEQEEEVEDRSWLQDGKCD